MRQSDWSQSWDYWALDWGNFNIPCMLFADIHRRMVRLGVELAIFDVRVPVEY